MSAHIRDEIAQSVTPTRERTWYGYFAQDVVSPDDLATIIVPDYDEKIHWTNCFWQTRDATTLPNAGDECLVAFDNRNQPWIISWHPAGGSTATRVTSVFGRIGDVAAAAGDYAVGQVTGAAPLASPAFTGTPTAPTPLTADNSTRVATTAFVKSAAPVTSVFGRTGAVTAATGDYTAAQITNAADKSSASTQAFSADVTSTGQFMASGGYCFRSNIANTSSWAQVVTVQGTAGNAIFGIYGQTLYWADPGGGSGVDTSLYRNAANQLRTGGYFQADSAIMATGGNSVIGTGAVLQGNNTYNAGNNWMSGMVGSGIYFDGANWLNKTFGGNNGWAAIGVRGASNPGGFDLYGVNATGATDRSYTPAQFLAQKFGSWTTDGTLTTLGRIFSGAAGTGGMWVDGGSNQFFGSVDGSNIGIYNAGWWVKIGTGGQIGFFAATPAAQQTAHGTTVNTRGVGTTWLIDNTTTGGVGSTAYTIQDIVAALKNYGLLVA